MQSVVASDGKSTKAHSAPNQHVLQKQRITNKKYIRLMCEWYHNFGKNIGVGMHLLKRVGRQVASKLEMDQLPAKWIPTLRTKHGVNLMPYRKQYYSKPIRITKPPPEVIANNILSKPTSISTSKSNTTSRQSQRRHSVGKQLFDQPLLFQNTYQKIYNPESKLMQFNSKPANPNSSTNVHDVNMALLPSPKQWYNALKDGKVLPRIKREACQEGKILYYECPCNPQMPRCNNSRMPTVRPNDLHNQSHNKW